MEKENELLLKELQNVELDILNEFIDVCDKLKINYFLIGGTLLGAVRHKGFIPWDDDIDVCMLRKDYDIFIENAQKYLPDHLFLQTSKTDKEYSNCFAKIRNSETTFIESSVKDLKINHGIYIDIFPLDNFYNYNVIKDSLIKASLYPNGYNKKSLKSLIVRAISKMMYGKKTRQELCSILEKMYTKANKKNINKVTNYGGAWGIKKETHLIEDFQDFELMDFEKLNVKVPIGYDRCLRRMYGNYMQLPPVEKRVTHHFTEVIDPYKPYTDYGNKYGRNARK